MNSKVPDCFDPEKNVAYPLCVGIGKKKCKRCNLYRDYEESSDESDGKDK